MRLRDIFWACLAGLAVSSVAHSAALAFATLTAAVVAAVIVTARRHLFVAVTFDRTLSRRVVSWGADLEITTSVANDKLLPLLWLRVHDQWPAGLEPQGFGLRSLTFLGRQEVSQTVSVRWYERLRRRHRVRCVQRGLHRLGPVELEAGDPFGVTSVHRTLEAEEEFAVLPKVLHAPGPELLRGRPLAEETVERSLAHDPTALRGIRPYRSGDPLRTVNWRATARTGALHTNEFDPASVAAVRLLLDAGSGYRPWESVRPETMELLCVTVASLAAAFDARGYAVGLASNACLTNEWRTPDLEPAHGGMYDVLEALARLRPATARDSRSLLAAELADETGTAECVLVTAALPAAVRDLVARLRAERTTVVVFVGRPEETELSLVDHVVPADFEWRTSDELPLRV